MRNSNSYNSSLSIQAKKCKNFFRLVPEPERYVKNIILNYNFGKKQNFLQEKYQW